VPDQRFIAIGNVIGGRNRLVRHDQDVHRGARVDVAERRDALVLVDDGPRAVHPEMMRSKSVAWRAA
jgi:hypothetical protein